MFSNFLKLDFLRITDKGVLLFIRLTPKSSASKIGGEYKDETGKTWLKAAVNAPPVDGAANKALIELLAKKTRLPKTSFSLVGGLSDRNKTLLIAGDEQTIRKNICMML